MLEELADMSLVVTRGYAHAAAAAAHAVEVILADEIWQPETGRARALAGARDAADAFQKVSRALRLALKLELTTAESLRDLRAGVVPAHPAAVLKPRAGGTPVIFDGAADLDRRRPAGSCSEDAALDRDRYDLDIERLVDVERPDRLGRRSFRDVVDRICADLGVAPDWERWTGGAEAPSCEPLTPPPPSDSETGPARPSPRSDLPDEVDRAEHPPP